MTNWSEYDSGLVGRGDLRLWVSKEALVARVAPQQQTRGGQARFSDMAIEAVLMLASLFRLPQCQAEGFARSLLKLMGLTLPVPNRTTLARAAPDSVGRNERAGVQRALPLGDG